MFPVLSPVVEVFTFSQLLQHPSPELSPVFILELLEAKGQMELRRVAAQERIVLPLFPDSGRTLEIKFMSKSSPAQDKCVYVSLSPAASVPHMSSFFFFLRTDFWVTNDSCQLQAARVHLCISGPKLFYQLRLHSSLFDFLSFALSRT